MVLREILGAHRIAIETGGYVSFDVQLTNSLHKHDHFELCLVLSGLGRYRHGAYTFELKPGDVFLAEPGVLHEITSFITRDLHLYFVTMSLGTVEETGGGVEDDMVASFLSGRKVASGGHEWLAQYLPLLRETPQSSPFVTRQVLKLFTLEMMNALSKRPVYGSEEKVEDDVSLALAFIERNLDRRLLVQEIADHVGVCERSLRRRFKEILGTTVVEEINNRRMRRAAHRLLMGFTVQEVAEYVGVFDPAQFTRSFTRSFGLSPKQFQKSYIPGSLATSTQFLPDISEGRQAVETR